MKILCKNKHWEFNEDYDINTILYLLIDRPNYITTKYDSFIWENNKGLYHRDYDLPAYVFNDGIVEWWKNNKCHRDNNKPARIFADGYKEYYNNNFIKIR